MLKLASERVVKGVPVTINVPVDGGETRKHKVRVDYRILTREQQQQADRDDDGTPEKDWMTQVVVGWNNEDFQDADGKTMEFSPENLVKVLGVSYARVGLVARYVELSAGGDGRRKN